MKRKMTMLLWWGAKGGISFQFRMEGPPICIENAWMDWEYGGNDLGDEL
jgi:hypothetical protein